jgi:hypothetical protein
MRWPPARPTGAFHSGEQSGEAFHLGNGSVSRSLMRSLLVLVGVALALGCGGIGVEFPPSADAGSAPGLPNDAGPVDAPAEPVTTCCRLDNERGERLDYKCSTALSVPWFEERGYRCWLVQ